MDWTDDEVIQCVAAYQGRGGMKAAMTRAVELAAARGGTMTAEALPHILEVVESQADLVTAGLLRQHITALSAEVATLQAKVKELEMLVVERQRLHADELATRMAAEIESRTFRAEMERLKAEIGAIHTSAFTGMDEPMTTEEGVRIVAEIALLKRRAAELGDLARRYKDGRTEARSEVERLSKALGAREGDVLTHFEAKNAALAEVERLKADLATSEDVRKTLAMTVEKVGANLRAAESRLAAVRERAKNTEEIRRRFSEALASHCTPDAAALSVAMWIWEADGLEGDAPEEATEPFRLVAHWCVSCGGVRPYGCENNPERVKEWSERKVTGLAGGKPQEAPCRCADGEPVFCRASRHPCSPTCTHEDADKPGHQQRIAAHSKQFSEGLTSDMLASDEPVTRIMHLPVTPEIIGAMDRAALGVVQSGEEQEAEGYEQGAEDMRNACLEVVQHVLQKYGISEASPMREDMKSAIDGAVP